MLNGKLEGTTTSDEDKDDDEDEDDFLDTIDTILSTVSHAELSKFFDKRIMRV